MLALIAEITTSRVAPVAEAAMDLQREHLSRHCDVHVHCVAQLHGSAGLADERN